MSRFHNDDWKDELRRENLPKIFTEVIIAIREDQEKGMKIIQDEMTIIKQSAFPSGDLEGHKTYHTLMIQRNRELRSLTIAIAEKTISGLVWATVVFVAFAIWNLIKSKMVG